jgi:hypothetical protein
MTYGIKQPTKVIESKGSDFLLVYRVPYGKDDTLEKDREYKLDGGSPVGNKQEWLSFAKSKGFKGVRFVEKSGNVNFAFVEK